MLHCINLTLYRLYDIVTTNLWSQTVANLAAYSGSEGPIQTG